VGQRKVKKTPCNSLFKHDLDWPTLTDGKHVLTCTNRTDLVIHDPHRPYGAAHLIRVRSMVQIFLGQRGVLMWLRTGRDSVNDNVFRLLNVSTTALNTRADLVLIEFPIERKAIARDGLATRASRKTSDVQDDLKQLPIRLAEC
jgi:hypothetical protein